MNSSNRRNGPASPSDFSQKTVPLSDRLEPTERKAEKALQILGIRTIEELAESRLFRKLKKLMSRLPEKPPTPKEWANPRDTTWVRTSFGKKLAKLLDSEPRLTPEVLKLLGIRRFEEFKSWKPYEDALVIWAAAEKEPGPPRSPSADPANSKKDACAANDSQGQGGPPDHGGPPNDGGPPGGGEGPPDDDMNVAIVTVLQSSGESVEGLYLRALHIGICEETELGRSARPTNADGLATVEYKAHGRVDLQVEAYVHVERSLREPRGRSEIIFDANDEVELTIRIEGDSSAVPVFDQIETKLRKVLTAECPNSTLGRLSNTQLELLASKAGVVLQQAQAVVASLREAKRVGAGFDPAVLFALFSTGHPERLEAFAATKRSRLHADLTAGIAAGLIAELDEDVRADLIERLGDAAQELAVKPASDLPVEALVEILDVAGLDAQAKVNFLNRLSKFEGSTAALLKALREDPQSDFPSALIDSIETTTLLSEVAIGHLPLVRTMRVRGIDQTRLPALTRTEIEQLVRAETAALPLGADASKFAEAVSGLIEVSQPTKTFAHRISAPDASASAAQIGQFLLQNGIELSGEPLALKLARDPQLLAGQSAGFKKDLFAWESAFKLAPLGKKSAIAPQLIRAKLTSAPQLVRAGKSSVKKALLGAMEEREIDLVFDSAVRTVASSIGLMTVMGVGAGSGTAMAALTASPISSPNLAEWAELFGSEDHCSCEHCSSVLSPGAYLADVLQWLDSRTPSLLPLVTHRRVLEDGELHEELRRADIPHIQLSCKNTLTPLPYLDLVNEQLEVLIARYLGPAAGMSPPGEDVLARQTTETQDQLLLQPEHVLIPVYELLAGSAGPSVVAGPTHPFLLPFDLRRTEAEAYLHLLGLSLGRLRLNLSLDRSTLLTQAEQASPLLGISELQTALITTPASGDALALHWGLAPAELPALGDLEQEEGPTTPTPQRANSFSELQEVPKLLLHANPTGRESLSFEELTDILRSRFVAGGTTPAIRFASDACSLEDARFYVWEGTSELEGVFDRLHRFLRLRQFVPFSTHELDVALVTLSAGGDQALSKDTLLRLSHAHLLAQVLGLKPLEALAFWGNLDTSRPRVMPWRRTPDSGFELVFSVPTPESLDREVPESFYEAWAGVPARAALPESDGRRVLQLDSARGDLVAAGLSQSLNDYAGLVATTLSITQGDLAELAGALQNVGLGDALTLGGLSALYRATKLAHGLGLAPGGLVHLARLRGSTLEAILSDSAALLTFVEEAKLATRSHDPYTIEWILAGVRLSDSEDPQDIALVADLGQDLLRLQQEQQVAGTEVVPPAASGTRATDAQLLATRRRDLVVQRLADGLALNPKLLEILVTTLTSGGANLLTAFLDPSLPAFFDISSSPPLDPGTRREPDATSLPDVFAALHQLRRLTAVVREQSLEVGELSFLLTQGRALGVVDFQGIVDTPSVSWERWVLLQRTFRLHVQLEGQLFPLLERVLAGESLVDVIPEVLGNSPSDVVDAFPSTPPAVSQLLPLLLRFAELSQLSKESKAGIAELLAWSSPTPESPFEISGQQVGEIIQVSRTSQGANWIQSGKEVRNSLREKQRDALVAVLLGARVARDAYSLSAYLLLDVEMSPCQLTSRLVQATSSVQTFVQRVGLGLEPPSIPATGVASLSDEDAEDWEWRKNYRVWEANRKVFLHPENYMEPELRLDKTTLFVDFENRLRQGELTERNIRDAIENYLAGLDEIGNLDIRATHLERQGDREIVHVIGRTRAQPHKYLYRWKDCHGWAPWERLDVAIEGNHLLLNRVDGKPHVFWLSFVERRRESPSTSTSSLGENPSVSFRVTSSNNTPPIETTARGRTGTIDVDGYPFSYFAEEEGRGFRLTLEIDGQPLSSFAVADSQGRAEGQVVLPLPWADIFFDWAIRGTSSSSSQAGARQVFDVSLHWAVRHEGGWSKAYRSSEPLEGVSKPDPERTNGYDPVRVVEKPLEFFTLTHQGPSIQLNMRLDSRLFRVGSFSLIQNEAHPSRPAQGLWGGHEADPADGVLINELERWTGRSTLPLEHFSGDLLRIPAVSLNGVATDGRYYLASPRAIFDFSSPPFDTRYTTTSGDYAFFVDQERSYFIEAEVADVTKKSMKGQDHRARHHLNRTKSTFTVEETRVRVSPHFHPWVERFRTELASGGLNALYGATGGTLSRQQARLSDELTFNGRYRGFADADTLRLGSVKVAEEDIDFSAGGAYSMYNWELFFHIPMLVADLCIKANRYPEAQRFLHFVFDPRAIGSTSAGSPQDFWRFRPFFENEAESLREVLASLGEGADADASESLGLRIAAWLENPFEPHAIAQVNFSAYQRYAVMRYCDVLIEWGDSLFAQETLEALNEAAQLYMIAAQILGRRPQSILVPPGGPTTSQTALEEAHDLGFEPIIGCAGKGGSEPLSLLTFVKPFCAPPNDWLLKHYWGRVEDRLFKVRNCLDLEGRFRQLPLFAPPIDPALLVRARAAGVDFRDVLSTLNSPPPFFRYQILLQRALDLCSEVRSLGAALLSAREKREAEHLAVLQSEQEVSLLEKGIEIRQQSVDEAEQNRRVLQGNQQSARVRALHYATLMGNVAPEELELDPEAIGATPLNAFTQNPDELQVESLERTAKDFSIAAGAISFIQGILAAIPNFKVGFTDPGATFGGSNLASLFGAVSTQLQLEASTRRTEAGLLQSKNQLVRRHQDWHLQYKSAALEHRNLERQIVAAEIRQEIAKLERESAELQRDHAVEKRDFLKTQKFTNEQLYQFQIDQLTTLYFQTYQLAINLAKQAEAGWKRELGVEDVNFIGFNYWDRARAGLLAGERLFHDLKRMEAAHLEHAGRELQLSRSWSLRLLDPLALAELRTTGRCAFTIPDEFYDLTTPDHYFRRIKQVSVSIPAVVGPHVPIHATLELTSSRIKKDPASTEASELPSSEEPAIRRIVTSHGQNDTGLFDVSGGDGRYLPFEGAGAASSWSIELPTNRLFDYSTIADVVLHIQYTARFGGSSSASVARIRSTLSAVAADMDVAGPFHSLSLKRDFSTQWHRMAADFASRSGTSGTIRISAALPINRSLLPYAMLAFDRIQSDLFVVVAIPKGPGGVPSVGLAGNDPSPLTGVLDEARFEALTVSTQTFAPESRELGLTLEYEPGLTPDDVEDVLLIPKMQLS